MHRRCLLLLRLRAALRMLPVPPQLCDQPFLELCGQVWCILLDELVSRHSKLLADLVDLCHGKALQMGKHMEAHVQVRLEGREEGKHMR
jgi:hypothetical protein